MLFNSLINVHHELNLQITPKFVGDAAKPPEVCFLMKISFLSNKKWFLWKKNLCYVYFQGMLLMMKTYWIKELKQISGR